MSLFLRVHLNLLLAHVSEFIAIPRQLQASYLDLSSLEEAKPRENSFSGENLD